MTHDGLGYTQPLYLLPFDHRESYVRGMFGFTPPLSPAQHDAVADSKRVIYEGFLAACAEGVAPGVAGILVDEEFGAAILRDAKRSGVVTATSTEHSGSDEFEFEYGEDFERHIEAMDPTFAKVLVRYNPDGDAALNLRQALRLKRLSDYCRRTRRRFMFELLVPATPAQLASAGGDPAAYDARTRPALVDRAIRELQDSGVDPDVWKIEGLDRREDCERIVATVRRDGRPDVGCIVLGRGADDARVRQWLATAAGVDGFIGFAVGRTSFWEPVAGWRAQKLGRAEAATRIGDHLREWIDVFERGRLTRTNSERPV
jgi:myo-inositol catabolism protein IolC